MQNAIAWKNLREFTSRDKIHSVAWNRTKLLAINIRCTRGSSFDRQCFRDDHWRVRHSGEGEGETRGIGWLEGWQGCHPPGALLIIQLSRIYRIVWHGGASKSDSIFFSSFPLFFSTLKNCSRWGKRYSSARKQFNNETIPLNNSFFIVIFYVSIYLEKKRKKKKQND